MDKLDRNEAVLPENEPHDEQDSTGDIEEDPDYTSSSGSSSDNESEAADGFSELENQPNQPSQAQTKPTKARVDDALKSRLAAFIPQLQRANQELEASGNIQASRIDHVDEHENQYIEMDLGLGVLSEQRHGNDGIKLGQSDSEDELISENEDESQSRNVNLRDSKDQQASVDRKKIEEI